MTAALDEDFARGTESLMGRRQGAYVGGQYKCFSDCAETAEEVHQLAVQHRTVRRAHVSSIASSLGGLQRRQRNQLCELP